jgi:cytochrome c oxidase subunit 4
MSGQQAYAPHAEPHPPPPHVGHAPHDHHPHVLPVSTYVAVFVTLLVLTVITVAASRVDLGNANLIIALGIATVKASCVALIFMHLLFDKKFNLVVFASSLIFLSVFIGFTMSDTAWRGYDGRISADGPADVKDPFAETRSQAALKRLYEKPAKGAKEIPIKDWPPEPKTDVGLHEATPGPTGEAQIVDVPAIQDAPGAVRPATKAE